MFNDPVTQSYPLSPAEPKTCGNTARDSNLGFTVYSAMSKNQTMISNPKSPKSPKKFKNK